MNYWTIVDSFIDHPSLDHSSLIDHSVIYGRPSGHLWPTSFTTYFARQRSFTSLSQRLALDPARIALS